MSQRARSLLAALALALVLTAVACSDDDMATPSTNPGPGQSSVTSTSTTSASPITTESTATSSSSTPSRQTAEDEVIARYIGYWDARSAANSGIPNPGDPGLGEYATGAQLDAVVAETQANLDQGLAFRRAANPAGIQRVHVVEIAGDHAVVQECVVSDGIIVRRDSGEIVNDEVATHNVRGELLRVDGAWRVSAARLIQRWEGVAGCALAT